MTMITCQDRTAAMETRSIRIIIIPLLLWTASQLSAEVTLTPHPDIVAIGAMQEPLPVPALIRASLLASGTAQEHITAYSKRLMDIVMNAPAASGNNAVDGEKLLKWMHENFLTKYIENETRMDVLLDKGYYNCVSSAVFYMILVSARNIPIHGVLAPDHAFCRLPEAGDTGIDVETTTAYGFDPGNRKEAVETFSGRTGFAYVPQGSYSSRQDIGEKELVALIYQNRISRLQTVSQWKPTVDMALEAWKLTGTNAYREYFLTSLKNLAAEADRTGHYEFTLDVYIRAAPLIASGSFVHELKETSSSLVNNAVVRLVRAGNPQGALAMLQNQALTRLVPQSFLLKQEQEIQARMLEKTVQTAAFEDAVSAVDNAFSNSIIDTSRWHELSLYLWSTEAKKRSAGKRWIKGWELLNSAPPTLKSNPQFSKLLDTYAKNTAVAYHNSFVSAFRKRDWQEARNIVSEGLNMFPTDSNLLKDRNILKESGN